MIAETVGEYKGNVGKLWTCPPTLKSQVSTLQVAIPPTCTYTGSESFYVTYHLSEGGSPAVKKTVKTITKVQRCHKGPSQHWLTDKLRQPAFGRHSRKSRAKLESRYPEDPSYPSRLHRRVSICQDFLDNELLLELIARGNGDFRLTAFMPSGARYLLRQRAS